MLAKSHIILVWLKVKAGSDRTSTLRGDEGAIGAGGLQQKANGGAAIDSKGLRSKTCKCMQSKGQRAQATVKESFRVKSISAARPSVVY